MSRRGRYYTTESNDDGVAGCLGYVIGYAIIAVIGGIASDYLIALVFHKDIPWYADAVIGIIGGAFVVAAAVIAWILTCFGVV